MCDHGVEGASREVQGLDDVDCVPGQVVQVREIRIQDDGATTFFHVTNGAADVPDGFAVEVEDILGEQDVDGEGIVRAWRRTRLGGVAKEIQEAVSDSWLGVEDDDCVGFGGVVPAGEDVDFEPFVVFASAASHAVVVRRLDRGLFYEKSEPGIYYSFCWLR